MPMHSLVCKKSSMPFFHPFTVLSISEKMGNSTPLKPEGLYCTTGNLAIASALVRTTGVKVPKY